MGWLEYSYFRAYTFAAASLFEAFPLELIAFVAFELPVIVVVVP